MYLNPFIFLFSEDSKLLLWNYKSHRQYELDERHAQRFIELIAHPDKFDMHNPIDFIFFENEVWLDERPPDSYWGWDVLSKIFHVGTKNIPYDDHPKDKEEWAGFYHKQCLELIDNAPVLKAPREINNLYLLPALQDDVIVEDNIIDTLLKRKTCRSFEKKAVNITVVGTVLYLAFGYLSERAVSVDDVVSPLCRSRRSSPSGGGLNSNEIYIYVNAVEGIRSGVHYYDPARHGLDFICEIKEPLGDFLDGQHFINDIAFGAFITARFDKMWWKYKHSRAYRVSLLDVGHLSQTFQLVCTAAGLSTWITAALTEEKIETLLNIETYEEQPVFFVGAGYSDGAVFSKELLYRLNPGQR